MKIVKTLLFVILPLHKYVPLRPNIYGNFISFCKNIGCVPLRDEFFF